MPFLTHSLLSHGLTAAAHALLTQMATDRPAVRVQELLLQAWQHHLSPQAVATAQCF